jgi:hypothetical protein
MAKGCQFSGKMMESSRALAPMLAASQAKHRGRPACRSHASRRIKKRELVDPGFDAGGKPSNNQSS